ncbi:MAG: hypothetical protein ACJAYU_001816 [Bradymonadia bacterium]|jgi:hypothetical protein
MRKFCIVALTGVVSLLAACGVPAGSAVVEDIDGLIAATGTGDFDALLAEAASQWENRQDNEAVDAAIEAWETAIHSPTDSAVDRRAAMVPVFTSLAHAYYWRAHAHLRFDDAATDEDLLFAYSTGMDYAAQAMALNNDEWRRALLYETPIPEAVVHLTPSDVPAVYWHATNLGRWGLTRGIATVLGRKDDIYALMNRVEEMDPAFYYNATNRYFGVYYTKLPFGNPAVDESQRRLEECISRHPEYLETRVLYAYDWATVTQNRAVAEEQLQIVLDADISQWPELYPENFNAQRRAERIMAELDEYIR